MKEIIVYNSSSRGAELKDFKSPAVEEMLVYLQIMTKIKNLLGENLPGTKFEAAKVQYDYFDRRRIRKTASQDLHLWAEFIPLDDGGNYLLLVPTVKILDDKIKKLSKEEILDCLGQAEKYAEGHPRETAKRMKKIEKKNRKAKRKNNNGNEKTDAASKEEAAEQDQKEENSECGNEESENQISEKGK